MHKDTEDKNGCGYVPETEQNHHIRVTYSPEVRLDLVAQAEKFMLHIILSHQIAPPGSRNTHTPIFTWNYSTMFTVHW